MTPKPDARIIPTQDEFDSWTLHPVTKFVAASYANQAQTCKDLWTALFNSRLVPVDLDTQRQLLAAKEECFRSFLESQFLDHLKSADADAWARHPSAAPYVKAAERRKAR